MPDSFLHLPSADRSQILRGLASQMDRAVVVLEKDVWVCWTLQHLFTMPGRLQMAFKGGTSLSKVFGAIDRFSEDVDITLDYRDLDAAIDPFQEGLSGNQLKKLSAQLKVLVRGHVHGIVAPYFAAQLESQFGPDGWRIELYEEGEQLRIHYPSVLGATGGYVAESVLLEFGGRNITEPNEEHEVKPDIADHLPDLRTPVALVSVLSPERTFWEKATLMHVECNRGVFRANAERLSRHWYDLAKLADLEISRRAVSNRALLADVVKHKKIFFNAAYANYDACLAGQLRLVPNADVLPDLQGDFDSMVEGGMFVGEAPSFEAIIERLRRLEAEINA